MNTMEKRGRLSGLPLSFGEPSERDQAPQPVVSEFQINFDGEMVSLTDSVEVGGETPRQETGALVTTGRRANPS